MQFEEVSESARYCTPTKIETPWVVDLIAAGINEISVNLKW